MKRMFTNKLKGKGADLFGRSGSREREVSSDDHGSSSDTPEANVARAIKKFCEAGGPNGQETDEVTFLPTIVDSAESSPAAAKEAMHSIRKHLDVKNMNKPYSQYNSLMLMRILADNPGPIFTRNVDSKFVSTIKDLFRNCRDPSVRQLLMETLDYFEAAKAEDPGLAPLKEWYIKEKSNLRNLPPPPPQPVHRSGSYPGAGPPGAPGGGGSPRPRSQLPPINELAARISEAQMSAKLLMQITQSTPSDEILTNQLIREFADRCSAASRSVQAYIEAQNPAPDESTMVTLFETNEQLATALSRHQAAVFAAKQKANAAAKQQQQQQQQQQQEQEQTNGYNISGSGGSGNVTPQMHAALPPRTPTDEITTMGSTMGSTGAVLKRDSMRKDQRYSNRSQPDDSVDENPFGDSARYESETGSVMPVPPPPPMPRNSSNNNNSGGSNRPDPISTERDRPEERHALADPSPMTPPGQQNIPHGFQPYRY